MWTVVIKSRLYARMCYPFEARTLGMLGFFLLIATQCFVFPLSRQPALD